jgi:diguanylate cyclase (GGDEF)-like protein
MAMKVLIADDDEVVRAALSALLERLGYEAVVCENGEEAWDALQAPDAPSLAILDWMMPGLTGIQVCRRLRERDRRPYQYVILLTSRDRAAEVTQGFDCGADDYLRKPFQPDDLRARLSAAERVLLHQDELRTRSTVDAATGLLNSAGIRERLDRELDRAAPNGTPVSVIVAAIESADARGTAGADELLSEAAKRVTAHLRPVDEIGRSAPDEIFVVLPDCDRREADAIAGRMRGSFGRPLDTSAGPVHVSASTAVATADAAARLDADALVAAADSALYLMRRSPGN